MNDINSSTNNPVPIWIKYTLTVQEASKYFRIGAKKLQDLINQNPNAEFILWNGNRAQIKRKMFELYLGKHLFVI